VVARILQRGASSLLSAPVAGEELVGPPAEQERVGALVGLVDERQGLVVEHPCVADHASSAIIWVRPGATPPPCRHSSTSSANAGTRSRRSRSTCPPATRTPCGALPDAEVCFDPFHVVKLANEAISELRRVEWNARGKSTTPEGKWIKGARWALLKAPERLTERQQATLAAVPHANRPLYRAYLLKEELRALYHLDDRAAAAEHLRAGLAWASRSKLKPFVKLARTIRRYQHGILAAIRLGLSNARLEGLNSKVRLISHRSFGFHGPDPLIALIYLCAGGITIDPPFTTNP
jgi:transposase